jgi:hypothetical protein
LFDPRQNILGGVKYLRMLLDMFQGDVSLAVAGYNAGEHAVQRHQGVPSLQGDSRVRQEDPDPSRGRERPADRRDSESARGSQAGPAKPSIIYKWRDGQGRMFLSDTPPPDRTPFEVLSKQGD